MSTKIRTGKAWDFNDCYTIELFTDEAATFRLIQSILNAIIETDDYRLSIECNHNDIPLQSEPIVSFGEGM